MKISECPFCGSNEGYMTLEKVYRYLYFYFDDEPNGASDDVTEYEGKRKICVTCNKIIPKNYY